MFNTTSCVFLFITNSSLDDLDTSVVTNSGDSN